MEQPSISSGAKLCYARLMQHAGKDDHCWPGQDTLAQELGTSHRQVQRYIQELVQCSLIETADRGMGKTQLYYFLEHPFMTTNMSYRDDGSVVRDTTDLSSIKESRREEEGNGSHEPFPSSSENDEEDYHLKVKSLYTSIPSLAGPNGVAKFKSPIQAIGPYFRQLEKNGDHLEPCDLEACVKTADALWVAFNYDIRQEPGTFVQIPLTFPSPTGLPALAQAWGLLERYSLKAFCLRRGLEQLVGWGKSAHPDVPSPQNILSLIAERPEIFEECLHFASKIEFTACD